MSKCIQIGNIEIDKNLYVVIARDEKNHINRSKNLNYYFRWRAIRGKLFPRDELIESIWGYDFDGNERTLDVHIGRLRARFPQEEYVFKIRTIRGLGYRLEVIK